MKYAILYIVIRIDVANHDDVEDVLIFVSKIFDKIYKFSIEVMAV